MGRGKLTKNRNWKENCLFIYLIFTNICFVMWQQFQQYLFLFRISLFCHILQIVFNLSKFSLDLENVLFAVEKKQILQRFCNSFWTLGDYKLAWNVWRHTHIFIFEFYLNTKFYKLDFPYAFEVGEEVQGGG